MIDYTYLNYLEKKLLNTIEDLKKIYHGFQMCDIELLNLRKTISSLEESYKELVNKKSDIEQN